MQIVLNEDVFGPLQNDSVIIVVQVHSRITYLRHLIVSLAQARDISRTLLIFSHDFYDEDINDLIQSIDFCKVMQVSFINSNKINSNNIVVIVFCRFSIHIQFKLILMSFLVLILVIVQEILKKISKYKTGLVASLI